MIALRYFQNDIQLNFRLSLKTQLIMSMSPELFHSKIKIPKSAEALKNHVSRSLNIVTFKLQLTAMVK